MKKSDLKTGMIVETKDGVRYLVMRDLVTNLETHSLVFATHSGEFYLESNVNECDIIKVYCCAIASRSLAYDKLALIWERQESIEFNYDKFLKGELAVNCDSRGGAEDDGIPDGVLAQCQDVIMVDSNRCMNVAVTGGVVMYDRHSKK